MNFKFVVKQFKITEIINGKLEDRVRTFICIEDKILKIIYPHPFSNFIKGKFSNKNLSLNTQKRYAEDIKKFLNFILDNIEVENETFLPLKEHGIKGLKLKHGAEYISYLTNRVTQGEIMASYVFDVERILTQFYTWLKEQNIIKENINIVYEKKIINRKTIKLPISPFHDFELGTLYPRKENITKIQNRKLHDFGNGRLDLVNLFLKVAELVAPDIALGIAFQFYGGLRRGEVVNLLRGSVKSSSMSDRGTFILNIEDNWEKLFPNKNNTVSEQVKKPRIQAVFNVPIVRDLYKKHNDNLRSLSERGVLKDKNALFCSNFTGKPITGSAYWERFMKVRKKFLEIVLESNFDDYIYLTSKPWSTHIGRGIYTNMITFLLGWNPSELALARGDSNIESAQSYIEEKNVELKTIEATEIIAKAAIEMQNGRSIKFIEELRSI